MVGVVLTAAAAGSLAGAALALPAYRLSVPWRRAGEPAVPPRDACRDCAGPLPAAVAGWLRLGARCPQCRRRLGPHAWLGALICGLGCAGVAWRFGFSPLLVPFLPMVVLGVLIGIVDLAEQRIPDVLVLPGIAGAVVLFAAVAALTGQWATFGRALAAGAGLFVVYALLGILPGAQLGGGDVALAGLIGICLGWLGWPVLFVGAFLPWLIQAPVALVALVARRAGRDTMLPFGPAMLVGGYLAVVGPYAVALVSPRL